MSERLAKGARKHIIRLKSEGKLGEAVNFRREAIRNRAISDISKLVNPDSDGLEGYNNLSGDIKSAFNDWFNIRYGLQTGQIPREQLFVKVDEFQERYGDEVLDDSVAQEGFRIINKWTSKRNIDIL